jgi:sec-independent protein translocase protein TatA
MGIGNIGITQLIILLVIVMLVFGTKKIRNLGGDLGSAIRDFRKGMNEVEAAKADIETIGKDGEDKPPA